MSQTSTAPTITQQLPFIKNEDYGSKERHNEISHEYIDSATLPCYVAPMSGKNINLNIWKYRLIHSIKFPITVFSTLQK